MDEHRVRSEPSKAVSTPKGQRRSLHVEVIVLGDPSAGYQWKDPYEWWERPLAELPHVVMNAAEDWLFLDILREAGRQAGVRISDQEEDGHLPSYVTFVDPADGRLLPLSSHLPMVNEAGAVRWDVDLEKVRYGDVLRAAAAGAIAGDPHRPVLVLFTGFGDGPGIDWHELLGGLPLAWQVLEVMSTVDGAGSALGRIRGTLQRIAERLRGRHRVEQARWRVWQQNGGSPGDLDRLVSGRPWTAGALASLLQCPSGEAEAYLAGCGFRYDAETKVWLPPPTIYLDELSASSGTAGGAWDEGALLAAVAEAAQFELLNMAASAEHGRALAEAVVRVVHHWAHTGEARSHWELPPVQVQQQFLESE